MLNTLLQTHSHNGFINYGNRKQKGTAGLENTKVTGPETEVRVAPVGWFLGLEVGHRSGQGAHPTGLGEAVLRGVGN